MIQRIIFCCLATLLTKVYSAPNGGQLDHSDALQYLNRFGYLGTRNPSSQMQSLTDPNTFKQAVRNLQIMGNIPVTGELDAATEELMKLDRCGNQDNVNMATQTRRKRYIIEGSRWGKTQLTYRIYTYTPDMPRSTVDYEIKKAFQVWEDQTPLTFIQIQSGTPDISIQFATLEHGDGNPFDGQGGTLAHAFFPRFGGDTHFDDAEYFTSDSNSGINLFQVAAHEFGHSLGLSHSRIQSALMAPFYRGYVRDFRLDNDDIEGIQYLYGPPSDSRTTTTLAPPAPTQEPITQRPGFTTPKDELDYCVDGQFDDLIMLGNKVTYGFRGPYYYKIDASGIGAGYPKLISQDWPGLPDNIDAAVSFPVYRFIGSVRLYVDDKIWFFKGNQIYQYNGNGIQTEYPRSISSVISGLPGDLDSIFIWSGNDMVYATKGSKYYRLNTQRNAVDPGYPRPLSVWTTYSTSAHQRQLNQNIDAAVEYSNGRTYFFIGPNYYRFNDQEFKVDSSYPRLVSVWWYGCKSNDIKQHNETEVIPKDNIKVVGGPADSADQQGQNSSSTTFTSLALVLVMAALVSIL